MEHGHIHEGLTVRVLVNTRSGYRADEAVSSFYLGDKRIDIGQTLDSWVGPDHRYFKVNDKEDNTYILRHDTDADSWELTFFRAAPTGRRATSEQSGGWR